MKRLVTLATILLVYGCSKSDGGTPTPAAPTKTTLLSSKDWLMTSKQYKKVTDATWTDSYNQFAACDKDDHYVFKLNGDYEANEGATKCSASDPFITETGTWKFAQNETMIIYTKTGSTTTQDATIETLDANTLVITYVERVSGVEYIIKQGYGH